MIILPTSGPKPLYYSTFVGFLKGILNHLSIPFQLSGEASNCYFVAKLDKKEMVFNFSDFYETPDVDKFEHYFKFHYSKQEHEKYKNVYSFSPVSFYDWKEYSKLKSEITYTGENNLILSIQRSYGDAKQRRSYVKSILKEYYGSSCIIGPTIDQKKYWELINRCLVHVFVPGARNDILDRAHLQYLAFGCCTISPKINDVLSYNRELVPGIHYIECLSDYSDLIKRTEWCKSNRNTCVEIGRNAKKLFEETCTPNKLWDWVLEKIQ